ncbi:hypothetical protein DYB32_010339, partial [Aphanomyces invadans]
VVQEDANRFCLDGDVDADGLAALTHASVTRLLQKDSPSLETIKMQLDFDLCYVKHEEEVEKGRAAKQKKIAALHRSIVLLQPNGTGDFDTLTTLYRQIFTLLMVHADADKTGDRNVEREVAAALKSFVSMSADDKKFQLKELASIVGGIRLFNKEIGKGGAGIGLTLDTIRNNVTNVSKLAAEEVEEANVVATEYTEVLLHVHHYNAKDSVTAERLQRYRGVRERPHGPRRWQEELNNKRQFLSYLQSLYEDIDVCVDKISRIMATYDNELNTLKALVGARTSLPKGQVYPVFEALSKAWEDLDAEHQLLLARSRSVKALMQFKDSFTRTLSPQSEWILKAKKAGMPSQDHWFDQATELDNQPKFASPSSSLASGGAKHASTNPHDRPHHGPTTKRNVGGDEGGATGANDDIPVRMSVDSTPEFMQLPLEYQGYCPWTLVRRGGLLLPGDPSLGVIQFRNAYHVFVNERALEEFMVDPAQFVGIVHDMVVRKPELIYLLRLQVGSTVTYIAAPRRLIGGLQETFPDTSMASLLRLTNNRTHVHPLLAPHAVQKVDAGTSTPTHFVEKNMDVNYEWNEWSLRRR